MEKIKMMKYIITAPNGQEFEIESETPPTSDMANEVFRSAGVIEPKNSLLGKISAFTKGGSFGLADKVGGSLYALGSAIPDIAYAGGQAVANIKNKGLKEAFSNIDYTSPKDRYNEIAANSKIAREEYAAENPLGSLGYEFAGVAANPINWITGNYILSGAKAVNDASKIGKVVNYVNQAGKLIPTMIRGTAVGGGTSLADTLLSADNTEEMSNLGRNTAVGSAIGAAVPFGSTALKLVPKFAGKVANKAGSFIDRYLPFLGVTDDEIKTAINTVSKGGYGSVENIGTEAKKIAKIGVEKINHKINQLYNEVENLTNVKAPASVKNSVAKIDDLVTELDKPSRTYLNSIKQELEEGVNTKQLNAIKRRVGEDVERGKASMTPNQQSRLYDGIKQDYYDSLKQAALSENTNAVERAITRADKFKAAMEQPRSPLKLFQALSNERTAESTIGNNIMKILTERGADTKKLKLLAGSQEALQSLRNELIPLINSKNMFNKLSPAGKRFIYGDKLDDFEKLFNHSLKDFVIDNFVNGMEKMQHIPAEMITPYISQIYSKQVD